MHGISGHHDHLQLISIVKHLFLRLKDALAPELKRLAFVTLPREEGGTDEIRGGNFKVHRTVDKYIDAVVNFTEGDR